jgi:hypothetical protein
MKGALVKTPGARATVLDTALLGHAKELQVVATLIRNGFMSISRWWILALTSSRETDWGRVSFQFSQVFGPPTPG